MKAPLSPNALGSIAITKPLNGASSEPFKEALMIGLATSRLERISIISESPDPLGPAIGNTALTSCGLVVSAPFASTPHPKGIDFPASRAAMIFPRATAAVDMSSRMGRSGLLVGAAIAIGFVETPSALDPA